MAEKEEKLPPHHPEAEMAVLGSMLIEPAGMRSALRLVKPTDFYIDNHRAIFEALAGMAERKEEADMSTATAALRRLGVLEKVGGASALAKCISAVSTAAYVTHYAKIVREASLERQFNRQLYKTAKAKTEENVKALQEILRAKDGLNAYDVLDLQQDLAEAIETIFEHMPPAISTGFPQLDKYLNGGVTGGDLIAIGARVSVGKTAFKVALAVKIAMLLLKRVTFVTTEMNKYRLLLRLLPMLTGIPRRYFRPKGLDAAGWTKLHAACESIVSKLPIRIVSKPRPSIEDLKTITYITRAEVLFVDYLQRCRFPKADTQALAISEFLAELQAFSQEQNVPIFISGQLDRKMDKAPKVAPTLSDFKDSGAIEAEASIAILLWRPPKSILKGPEPEPGCTGIEAILAKNRDGPAWKYVHLQLREDLVEMCAREDARQQDEDEEQVEQPAEPEQKELM